MTALMAVFAANVPAIGGWRFSVVGDTGPWDQPPTTDAVMHTRELAWSDFDQAAALDVITEAGYRPMAAWHLSFPGTIIEAHVITVEPLPVPAAEWCTGCNRDHDPAECGYAPVPAHAERQSAGSAFPFATIPGHGSHCVCAPSQSFAAIPATDPRSSSHLDGCGAGEDPDGETMCVCASIEAEPKPDPREEEECTPELVDGHVIGCGVCEACR